MFLFLAFGYLQLSYMRRPHILKPELLYFLLEIKDNLTPSYKWHHSVASAWGPSTGQWGCLSIGKPCFSWSKDVCCAGCPSVGSIYVHSASHMYLFIYPCLILTEANSGMSGISTFCANQCLGISGPSSFNKSRVCSTTVQDLGSYRILTKLLGSLLFPAVVIATQNAVLQLWGMKIPFFSRVSVS